MTLTPAFSKILEPLQLRHKTLRNRINFGAHTANMAEDGMPGARHLGYYLERARGGAAMIVVEPMPVHRTARLTRGNFRHDDDVVIPGFRAITDACKAEGAVMIHQLYHVGQHGDYDNSYSPNWSPSGLPSYHDGDGSHRMREAEIEEIIESFVGAAVRAKKCGFDGVELFGPYNSLIEQFWLPWSNRRDDRWGGRFENRMRFSTEITSRIRSVTGDGFIIGLASSIDASVEVGMNTELLQEIAAYHDARALIDYISCGTGSYFDHSSVMPTFLFPDKLGAPNAHALKEVCKHTRVQAESHIRTPENANEVISSRQADMVSIVRGQIADPHWVNKVASGRDADIRGCISCNQMCWGRRSRDYWISCLVNPSAGREFEWGGDRFAPSMQPKRVLVVGGGPAGLEAARVAAERGHSVTLAEAGPQLGGQFRLAGLQARRSQILELIDWYERQLTRLGVSLLFNTPLDAGEVAGRDFEEIVIATGSQPAGTGFQRGLPGQDRLPGVDLPNVWSVEDVMTRTARLGDHVLLIDDTGDWRGLGTALEIVARGHRVTVVTSWPVVGRFLQRTESDERRESGKWWSGEAMLDGIEFIDYGTDPNAMVNAFEAGEVDLNNETGADYVEILDGLGLHQTEIQTATTLVARTNVTQKPYDDKRVRNALQMAVDNDVVLQLGYAGRGTVGENHFVSPIHPEYYPLPKKARDAAGAKKLMAEAGQADFEHELITVDDDWNKSTGDAIAAQLRDAGIKVKRTVLPGSTFWNDWTKYPYSVTVWYMRPLGVQVLALAFRTGEAWNETGYSDPEFDKKLKEALSVSAPEKRREVMKDIETIIQDSGIIIQPYWQKLYNHMSKKVKNYSIHPTFQMDLEKVWLEQD